LYANKSINLLCLRDVDINQGLRIISINFETINESLSLFRAWDTVEIIAII